MLCTDVSNVVSDRVILKVLRYKSSGIFVRFWPFMMGRLFRGRIFSRINFRWCFSIVSSDLRCLIWALTKFSRYAPPCIDFNVLCRNVVRNLEIRQLV